jgi:hypothetical protein
MSEPEPASEPSAAPWWGEFRIPHGAMGKWRIGPMTMWIERLRGEWSVATVIDEDHEYDEAEVRVPVDVADRMALTDIDHVLRFGVSHDDELITITPRLADRLVVTTPVNPFYIPAGEEVTIFVGSPLWLRLHTSRSELCEFPIYRPSDTWFGANTLSGELGYASRTACRLRFEEFQVTAHRAVTAVTVHNHAKTSLLLERMKLPVEYLPLFVSDNGVFWTRDLDITHTGSEELAGVKPGSPAPRLATNPRPVSEPRFDSDDNLVMKIFASIFR